jgi:hypothetical protein
VKVLMAWGCTPSAAPSAPATGGSSTSSCSL